MKLSCIVKLHLSVLLSHLVQPYHWALCCMVQLTVYVRGIHQRMLLQSAGTHRDDGMSNAALCSCIPHCLV